MKVLIVEPGQYPREADIEPTLEAKQKIVGGLIDVAYPFPDDNVCVVLNDEGKLMGLPLNRALGDYDVIAGTFFVCGYNEENFVGLTPEQLLEKLAESFTVEDKGTEEYRPTGLHNFSMYLGGHWYSLTAKPGTYDDNDPIGVLDVTVLSNLVLDKILDIKDLRTSKRIDFVGGIRGLGELKRRVDSGEMKAAFALYPVSMQQLINIADTGNIMPPKTTWFEPKLRSGVVIHSFEE